MIFIPAELPPVHEEIPENGFEHMEYALSASGIFSGWDIAFYWADVYSDAAHLKRLPGLFPGGIRTCAVKSLWSSL